MKKIQKSVKCLKKVIREIPKMSDAECERVESLCDKALSLAKKGDVDAAVSKVDKVIVTIRTHMNNLDVELEPKHELEVEKAIIYAHTA